MQIALHLGANRTDDDRLLKSILRNGDLLREHGVKAPGPGKYRRILRETIQTLDGAPPAPDARQVLLDSILDEDAPRRLVMSNENFICIANRIFDKGRFYDQTTFKIKGMVDLFPDDELSIYLGLRDPATFLPAVFAESKYDDFGRFLQGIPLGDIRWSDVVGRILAAAPHAKLTVWCNEDTPFIWGALIRQICGIDPVIDVSGEFDLLEQIMQPAGLKRMRDFLAAQPNRTDATTRQVIAAFLDKYGLEDEIEETIDLPGLDAQTVAELSAAYEEDVDMIASLPNVTFIEA